MGRWEEGKDLTPRRQRFNSALWESTDLFTFSVTRIDCATSIVRHYDEPALNADCRNNANTGDYVMYNYTVADKEDIIPRNCYCNKLHILQFQAPLYLPLHTARSLSRSLARSRGHTHAILVGYNCASASLSIQTHYIFILTNAP